LHLKPLISTIAPSKAGGKKKWKVGGEKKKPQVHSRGGKEREGENNYD